MHPYSSSRPNALGQPLHVQIPGNLALCTHISHFLNLTKVSEFVKNKFRRIKNADWPNKSKIKAQEKNNHQINMLFLFNQIIITSRILTLPSYRTELFEVQPLHVANFHHINSQTERSLRLPCFLLIFCLYCISPQHYSSTDIPHNHQNSLPLDLVINKN